MAPGPKSSLFQRSALASGLVNQAQIDRATAALRLAPNGPPTPLVEVTDEQLAAKLVEMGVLTQYQSDQLKDGRTKLNLGPYIITDWIGQGGMGQVFKAVHEIMGRPTAVKVLPLNKSTPKAIANFMREIRTQAQLDHPNLVHAYDAGHDGNVHYLVTEYVPGTDLRRLVRSQGPLTMQQAANVVMQAALGLDYAHQRGLVHRDVKPGNVLVTPNGIAKVSDLGLSGFLHDADTDPRSGKVVGTADYLSPEQIKSPGNVTCLSDIYSLGCSLYYAVCGKVPYPGGSPGDKARRHCDETPWHPRRFNMDISEEFVEIIADMMEKDPVARIQTAREVALRLEPWATEGSFFPSQQLSKSPWMPAPLPTTEQLTADEMQDTDVGVDDGGSRGESQVSQGTDAISSAKQDTRDTQRRPPPPPTFAAPVDFPDASALSPVLVVLITLAVSIPVSLVAGALLGAVLWSIFQS